MGDPMTLPGDKLEKSVETWVTMPARLICSSRRDACLVHIYPTGPGMGSRYEGEVRASGMLHAALVTAPMPSARVLGIETARARALAGCAEVLTHENALRIPPAAMSWTLP